VHKLDKNQHLFSRAANPAVSYEEGHVMSVLERILGSTPEGFSILL
jgi:hypothetical protein